MEDRARGNLVVCPLLSDSVWSVLPDFLPGRPEPGEEFGELAGDHGARVRAREVRTVGGSDALLEREGLAVGGQPAGTGGGVLREEADELTRGALGAEVARAPVAELVGIDLEQFDAGRAGDLRRAVARAGVDHEHLLDALSREGIEELLQVALPVLDGDHAVTLLTGFGDCAGVACRCARASARRAAGRGTPPLQVVSSAR